MTNVRVFNAYRPPSRRPDPRGPVRVIVEAWSEPTGNYYVLSCGHTATHAPHFALAKVGSETRCVKCYLNTLEIER